MDVALQVPDATAVRVAVRVRPLITRELLQGSKPCISTDGPCVTVGRDRRFTFDHAFGPSTQQEQVYRQVVSPLVESCFEGFNVTVLAYGQTGSGKTFTMGTGECGAEEDQMGIAPRVIRHVFGGIESRKHAASFQVRAQFLEIYNEDVKDLLVPPAEQATKWISREREQAQGQQPGGSGGAGPGGVSGITLRDAGDGTIIVVGAVEEEAQCAEDLEELLERGLALRATSSTCANEQSSRSHAILTIIIEQHLHQNQQHLDAHGSSGGTTDGGSTASNSSAGGAAVTGRGRLSHDGTAPPPAVEIRTAKLHLVDLAGSERTKQLRSSMQGTRFRETVNINQGLLALGNVISALGDERRRGSHVPYRESKLTRLLQDSLGGNSRTAMIACVSPADDVLEETLNTLKYANRAKNIRNKPVVNRALPAADPLGGAVQHMQLQVLQQLAAQLPDGELARGLPLAELLALDTTDPAACLDVLARMRSALATSGASSRATSMDGSQVAGLLGRQLLLGSLASPIGNRNGGSGAGSAAAAASEVEALVSGCSRAIAGILHGLAEMEAQRQITRGAREHILRSLDASTLRLLPVVRSMCSRGSTVSTPGTPQAAAAAALAAAAASSTREGGAVQQQQQPAGASGRATDSGDGEPYSVMETGPSDRERELEERVRLLEAELSNCRAELREAQEDLERDEIIFADKMKEVQEIQASSADLKQQLQEAEERHTKEVEELRRQVEALQASEAQPVAAVTGRPAGWVPSRNVSRSRLRRGSGSGSGSGYQSVIRKKTTSVPFTTLRVGGPDGDGAVAAAAEDMGSSGGGGVESTVGGACDDVDGDGGGERGAEEDEVLYDEELLSYISETDYTELHRREVLESDAALREELAEVLRDKAAAEAERAALERAALAQRSSFDEARAALEQQLSWLSGNISVQQQQLQVAQTAEREARELAAKWQERAQELEAAIEAREESLQRLRSELEAVEGNMMRSAEERAALRQQYEQKIAAVVAQVSTLQRQLQQHASAAAAADRRERQQSAEKAAALEAELTRMRAQQADLRRQLSERVARYERESAARLKELAALRKSAATARSRMAALEQENRAQRLLLRAKQQEVMAAEQRLRDSQRAGGGGGGGGSARSRSSSPGRRGYLGRGGGAGGGGNNSVPSTSSGEAESSGRPKSPSLCRGQGPQSGPLPQRPWGQRSSSLQRLEDIAAEELQPPLRRSTNNANNSNSAANSNGSNSNTPRGRQGRPPNPAQGQGRLGEAAAGSAAPLEPEEKVELEEWAEELLGLVSEVAGVEARVEVLSSRHRELLSRRELLLREQSQFSLRTRRRAEQMAQAVVACEAELADLTARSAAAMKSPRPSRPQGQPTEAEEREPGTAAALVEDKGDEGSGTARLQQGQQRSEEEGEGGQGGAQQAAALQQRMADVREARDLLRERLRSGRLLDEREQQIVDSLDDQLDDLETQLSYVTGELADRRAALSQLQQRREQLQQRSAGLGASGLRLALSAATEAVGHRAYQVRQLEAALAASEAGAARREAQLQFRLRESLVSLSAHLASLEAASPHSSTCLESAELRNLLGIYLDLDLAPPGAGHSGAGPGSSSLVSAQRAGQQHAGGAKQLGAGAGGSGGRSGTGTGDGAEQTQRQQPVRPQHPEGSEERELLPQAESLAVWGSRPCSDGFPPTQARRTPAAHQPQPHATHQHPLQPSSARNDREALDLSLSLHATKPLRAEAPPDGSWPRSRGVESYVPVHEQDEQQQREQRPPNGVEQARVETGEAKPSIARVNRSVDYIAALMDSGISGGGDFDGSGSDTATDVLLHAAPGNQQQRHQQQQQQQQQPQHQPEYRSTASGGQGGLVAPPSPTTGILRRTGSMDSMGSSSGAVSSAAKRVTWSAHITTGPGPGASASAASAAQPPPSPTRGGNAAAAGAGGGAAARGREKSILDRAGVAMWERRPAARRVSFGSISGGSGSSGEMPASGLTADATDEEGVTLAAPGQPELRSSPTQPAAAAATGPEGPLHAADVSGWTADAGGPGRETGGGDLSVPATLGGRVVQHDRASFTSLSRSSVDTDDTVAASDAGAVADDPGADEAALKASVRSFNPWRGHTGGSAGAAKQPRADVVVVSSERQAQRLQGGAATGDLPPGRGAGSHPSPRLAPQAAGGVGHGGEDDLLGAQDWGEVLTMSEEPRDATAAALLGSGGGRDGVGQDATTARTLQPGLQQPTAVAALKRKDKGGDQPYVPDARSYGYDIGDDELDEHVRLLEEAASALTAAPPARRHAHTPFVAAVAAPTPRIGGAADSGSRSSATPFGYSAVFDDEPDSHVYFFSNDPTPREPAGSGSEGAADKATRRSRFSLDRPAPGGASGARGGSGSTPRVRSNNSAPLPLQAPARSISPVQHHYGRLQRQKPAAAAPVTQVGPAALGPFTTPKPVGAMTALTEALMPYKAHLKRSAAGNGAGRTSGANGTGGSGVSAGRTDTPEGRRLAPPPPPSGIKAAMPGQSGQLPPQAQAQPQRYPGANTWSTGSEEVKAASAAFAAQRQQAHPQQQQQPWRTYGQG